MDDLERQLHNYWSDITEAAPAPDVEAILGITQLTLDAPSGNGHWAEQVPPPTPPTEPRKPHWLGAVAAAAVVVVTLAGIYMLTQTEGLSPGGEVTETTALDKSEPTAKAATDDPGDGPLVADPSGAAPTAGTPLPDIEGAIPGDDGVGPLPLGTVAALPDDDYLDFLFEFCSGGPCFRDAHFMQPDDPTRGSGPYTSGRPFYVRQGFVNDTGEPLGEGFDVALYVFPMDQPGEFDGSAVATTTKYTSDYVIQGETDQCGPTYRDQTGAVTCEWFVHEFPDGLPEGRFALWAVWEAPCSAWIDLGFTDSCADPNEVVSFFSSGVDSPFGPFPASYDEQNEAGLSDTEIKEIRDGLGAEGEPLTVDASGAAPTAGTPLPDVAGAVPYDDESGPLPLGTVTELPASEYLDFLFEHCPGEVCFRDAHFASNDDPTLGFSLFESERPFYVRQGFVNDTGVPLGEGFDVVIYVYPMDQVGEYEGSAIGSATRYTSDYVVRGESDRCGPGYNDQEGPVTCEWFVHEFPDGLPEGRFALWAFWEAPCSAWVSLGFTESCEDPNEVMSLFSSGVDSPFAPPPTEPEVGHESGTRHG